jgi:hypothetical protein
MFVATNGTTFLTGKKKGDLTTTINKASAKQYATEGAAKMAAGWANNNASLVSGQKGFQSAEFKDVA